MHRRAGRIAEAVLPLTLVAAAAALVAPSRAVAEAGRRALGRPAARPRADRVGGRAAVRRRGARRVLALGVAPTEVAAVGLVALAGADAVLALAVVAASLVASVARLRARPRRAR